MTFSKISNAFPSGQSLEFEECLWWLFSRKILLHINLSCRWWTLQVSRPPLPKHAHLLVTWIIQDHCSHRFPPPFFFSFPPVLSTSLPVNVPNWLSTIVPNCPSRNSAKKSTTTNLSISSDFRMVPFVDVTVQGPNWKVWDFFIAKPPASILSENPFCWQHVSQSAAAHLTTSICASTFRYSADQHVLLLISKWRTKLRGN